MSLILDERFVFVDVERGVSPHSVGSFLTYVENGVITLKCKKLVNIPLANQTRVVVIDEEDEGFEEGAGI